MGRSVPPWRMRIERELGRLAPYRRALPANDRRSFDTLLDDVRQRRAAGGMLPDVGTWQPMYLSMVVGLMTHIAQLNDRIKALEEGRHDD